MNARPLSRSRARGVYQYWKKEMEKEDERKKENEKRKKKNRNKNREKARRSGGYTGWREGRGGVEKLGVYNGIRDTARVLEKGVGEKKTVSGLRMIEIDGRTIDRANKFSPGPN